MATAQSHHPQAPPLTRSLDAAARRVRPSTPPPPLIQRLLESTDVRVNGDRPWDIQVHDPSVYQRTLRDGSLGLGEAYMQGAWDSAQLDETFTRLLRHDLDGALNSAAKLQFAYQWLKDRLSNRQSRARAFTVGERHYDIGNDVYRAMLDPTMSYSCGYWRAAATLEEAQLAKLDLTCRKLNGSSSRICPIFARQRAWLLAFFRLIFFIV